MQRTVLSCLSDDKWRLFVTTQLMNIFSSSFCIWNWKVELYWRIPLPLDDRDRILQSRSSWRNRKTRTWSRVKRERCRVVPLTHFNFISCATVRRWGRSTTRLTSSSIPWRASASWKSKWTLAAMMSRNTLDWTDTVASASLGLPSGKSSPAEPKSSSHVSHHLLFFFFIFFFFFFFFLTLLLPANYHHTRTKATHLVLFFSQFPFFFS